MKQKGFAPITIFALIALVIVGYLGYKNFKSKSWITPSPIATPDLMPGWKTYTNTKYNFLFKYPGNFGNQGAISGPATGTSTGLVSLTDPKTVQPGSDAHFDGFSVYVVTKLNAVNFDQYINKEITAMNKAKFTGMKNPTKIQLANGIALVSKDEGQAYYYLPNSDQSELVVFAYLQANASFKQTFDQVLSTFKFLVSPTIAPTATYACPANGWVDCQPSGTIKGPECSPDAMAWYKANCPNFQGGAL